MKIQNDGVVFEVPQAERLMDYLPDGCGILFGCQKGSCGTCVCTVRSGEGILEPKSQVEEETIRKSGGSANQRLFCQLWVRKVANEGEIEIEY